MLVEEFDDIGYPGLVCTQNEKLVTTIVVWRLFYEEAISAMFIPPPAFHIAVMYYYLEYWWCNVFFAIRYALELGVCQYV